MHRLVSGGLAAITISVAGLMLLPSPTAADEGFETTATTTYTVDFPAGVVRAQIELSFENIVPNERDGNTIISTYFSGVEYGIQGDATAVTARAGETPLTVTVSPYDADLQRLAVEFPGRLDFGEHLDVVINYDLPGHPPRTESPWRANQAFAAFVAYAYGDAGRSTVRVVTPSAADLQFPFAEEDGVDPQISVFGDANIYTFADLADPDRFASPVVATDNDTLASSTIDVGGREVVLQAWPDDPDWATFVGDRISVGLPELERLIGQPIRDDRQLLVRESIQPVLEGYGGWYLSITGEIELGEELDSVLMYHELAHAWFNEDTSPSRWVGEGLAETYANLVMANTGETPLEPEVPAADAAGRQPLEDWDHPYVVAPDEAAEEYGYATSFYVVDAIVDEIGTEAMATVLAAIDDELEAYRGDGPPEDGGVTDWRRLLDLLEQVGGSAGATELFRSYVVPADELTSLDERSAVRERYAELVSAGAGWAAPTVVRTAMEDWDFPAAESAIETSLEVLDGRDSLVAAAETAAVTLPDDLESRYEAADAPDGLTDLDDELATLSDAIGSIVAAESVVQAQRPIEQLGLAGEDFTDELATARTDITDGDAAAATSQADAVVAVMAGAEQAGRERLATVADLSPARWWLAVVAAAVALLLTAVFVGLRRGRSRRSGGVGTHVDPTSDATVDGDVEVGIGGRIQLDEDALAGAGLGGIDDRLDVAPDDGRQGPGATRVIEREAVLADVGDPVLELHEDVGAVVDAEPVPGAEVLVDPNAHGRGER